MLAMDVNDNAASLVPRGVWTAIASKLAPAGFQAFTNPPVKVSARLHNRAQCCLYQ
ncbi:hypothetical protein [Pseudomonas sp. FEN]|nr:hypothetical protein [Pseudomonas sp. FEN]